MTETYNFPGNGVFNIDSYIYENTPNTNYGTDEALMLGTAGATLDYASIVKVVLSIIPTSFVVQSAILSLYQTGEEATASEDVSVFRLLMAWSEAGVTWNKYDGTNAWQTAGAQGANDRDSTVLAVKTLSDAEANGYKDWTLNAAGIAVIQGFINGSITNNGLIINGPLNTANTKRTMGSSDNATSGYRPKLAITGFLPSAAICIY